ncbi:carbonic anhydrase, partial [Punctularia strigosozonata HHB-11173 SS5]|uniref:carbonic anhydrase n=1 Tax=Punctularia strigosozonata (strain HHB-11173) TaxID=741275 RepID=UPI0004418712
FLHLRSKHRCTDYIPSPAHFLGLKPGEAVVIRVAGGSVREVVRSLVICQRFTGAKEIALFRHTNCGGLTFTAESLRELILSAHPGDKEVAEAVEKVDLSGVTDVEDALNADLKFLHEHPLVLKDTLITGWIFDVETGKVRRSL